MKILTHLFVLVGIIIHLEAWSQPVEGIGAASLGIAHASNTTSNGTSLFQNPAGLGFLKQSEFAFGYFNRFEINGLSTAFATYTHNMSNVGLAVGVAQYGDDRFRHALISAGLGNKWGIAALGFSLNIHQINIEGYGSRLFPSITVSGLAQLSDHIWVSGVVRNLTQSKISRSRNLYYTTLLSTGVSYKSETGLNLHLQIDKDLIQEPSVKFGLEYQAGALILRTGINSRPLWYTFGTGLSQKRLSFNYAIQFHPVLQRSHAFSVGYLFNQ